jgi:hypothetical protein
MPKTKPKIFNFSAISSVLLLAIATIYSVSGYFSKARCQEKTIVGIFGLLCSALITYIISESLREKRYQDKVVDIINELTKIEQSFAPFKIVSSEERYHIGTEIARNAKERIVLFAGSLIMLTGPKPYCGHLPLEHEREQDDLFMNIAAQSAKKNGPAFYCSFIANRLYEEVSSAIRGPDSDKFIDLVLQRVNKLEDYCSAKKSTFRLREAREGSAVSYLVFIIGDSRFAVWLKNAVNPGYDLCISGENQPAMKNLLRLFEDITAETNFSEIKKNIIAVRNQHKKIGIL